MPEQKINLEKILNNNTFIETTSIEMYDKEFFNKIDVIRAMKEACKQALELAAENAELDSETLDAFYAQIDKQSILNVINLIE